MEDSIKRVEHVWCEGDDRWVYIEYNEDNDIIGLNFRQGDEYENFKELWTDRDLGLSEYYTEMVSIFNIERQSNSNLGFINKVIWSYHIAIEIISYERRK